MAQGADPNAKDDNNESPIDVAKKNDSAGALRALEGPSP